MLILGIDPGYALTGYSLLDVDEKSNFNIVDFGIISTDAETPFPERLLIMQKSVAGLIDLHRPDMMAIEELFFCRNITTAIGAAQARGVIICAAAAAGIDVYEYTPKQVKAAVTGYGNAEKRQVQEMVRRILNLKTTPKPDDVADALAIAICHANSGNKEDALAVSAYR